MLSILAACVFALPQTQPNQSLGSLLNDGKPRTIAVWARAGLIESPVSFCFDDSGNMYVAETGRAGNAASDTRNIGHLNAVEDDLKFRSVEDRRAQIRRWIAQGAFEKDYFTKTEDRVRIVRDTAGSGVADWSGVFADGFRDEVDGIGAGVLFYKSKLYYTCIPNLWSFTPSADRLKAESKESLAYGYGVRWCFFGHDLHGLVAGPDGRVYFSMGDRGYNVKTREGVQLFGPDRGGIFRCWPDGSGLELFHDGLRNPQELAFDERGDLFTGDNNCDSGDRARLVYVNEGGDSGWRQDVQSLPSRGPWNREFMWHVRRDHDGFDRPAWSMPPVEYVGNGPSGLTLVPGTGEEPELRGRLLMVDFYGSGSAIHLLKHESDGAGFIVKDHRDYYRGTPTITDLAWGLDSRLYLTDWGGGWSPNPNGRVLVIENAAARATDGSADRVKALLMADLSQRPIAELLGLLADADQRVRLRAQDAIIALGSPAVSPLAELARLADVPPFARLHAIWSLGQLARMDAKAADALVQVLADSDAEIRNHAVRTLGDLRAGEAGRVVAEAASAGILARLTDASPRVRASAALALGKLGVSSARDALLGVLQNNAANDRVVADEAASAMAKLGEPTVLATLAKERPAPVRLGVVVALRKMATNEASDAASFFFLDADPAVAVEAARAVYDTLPAFDATPAAQQAASRRLLSLASIAGSSLASDRAIEPLVRRVIAANVRIGDAASAARLVSLAAAPIPDEFRLLALDRVLNWDKPTKREDVWGNWVDLPARAAADAKAAIADGLQRVLAPSARASAAVTTKARELEARYTLSVPEMVARLGKDGIPETEAVALLHELNVRDRAAAETAANAMLDRGVTGLGRAAAEKLLVERNKQKAATRIIELARTGPLADRQRSILLLGTLDVLVAREEVAKLTQQMVADEHDDGVSLEIYQAAMKQPNGSAAKKLATPLGKASNRPEGYADSLLREGGDVAAGHEVFFHHQAAECLRCHTVLGEGGTATGGQAGPNLTEVGLRLSRGKLIESICEPNAVVAKGYGTTSAMPVMTQYLSPREVRDVVAYLTSLRGGSPQGHAEHASAAAAPASSGLPWPLLLGVPVAIVAALWRAMTVGSKV